MLTERQKHTVTKSIFQHALKALIAVGLALCVSLTGLARQGGTTRYVYDESGRLHAVILPSGEAVVYEYDAAGNITAVRRLAADALAIFSFTPHEGIYGDRVVFTGVGFGGGVSEVSFNGAAALVVEVTPSTVVAEVPQGATTGPVTITTPRGSVTTAEPFTISGVIVTPSSAVVRFAQSVQFVAQVLPPSLDQAVRWSVNGVEGGDSSIGTISDSGLYTAPSRELASVTVRATSAADPLRYAEAHVRVRNPDDVQGVFAASVSVSRGVNAVSSPYAKPVSVQRGSVPDSRSANSKSVSVQFGNASGVSTVLSPSVAVQRGETGQVTAYTNPPVSVRYGDEGDGALTLSRPVTATSGPVILSVGPATVVRGTNVTVTLTGANLSAATALRFINEGGSNDTAITVSNLTASPDGASLTATFAVSSGAALGRRVIVVVTPDGSSQIVDIGTNTVTVVAP